MKIPKKQAGASSNTGRQRPVVICRAGLVVAAAAYTLHLAGAVAVMIAHGDPLYALFVAADTILVGFFIYKLYKLWRKSRHK